MRLALLVLAATALATPAPADGEGAKLLPSPEENTDVDVQQNLQRWCPAPLRPDLSHRDCSNFCWVNNYGWYSVRPCCCYR